MNSLRWHYPHQVKGRSSCFLSARRLPWDGYGSLCLTGGDSRRPLHIILYDGSNGGTPGYMLYSSADKGGYPIRDGEKLMEELLDILY